MNLDLETVRALAKVLAEHDITEFEHEADGVRVKLVRGARPVVTALAAQPAAAAAAAPVAATTPVSQPPADTVDVTSPFVGSFYRSPSPDAPSFVEVGLGRPPGPDPLHHRGDEADERDRGRVLGHDRRDLRAERKTVEFGQKIFRIKKA